MERTGRLTEPRVLADTDRVGSVPALDRALDILERLSTAAEGQTLSELSNALGMPKNAVFRIAHTLVDRGYLSRDPKSLRFRLTTKLFMLSRPRTGDTSLVESALPAMRALRDRTRETVQLGIRVGDEGIIIERVEGLHPVRIAVDIGLRFPLYNNAPGKTLLAFGTDEDREAYLARTELRRCTIRTITDRDSLRRECAKIRSQEFGTDWAEADEGIHCVASPVFDREGRLAAALWVSAPSGRMPAESFPEVGQSVLEAARQITRRVGE